MKQIYSTFAMLFLIQDNFQGANTPVEKSSSGKWTTNKGKLIEEIHGWTYESINDKSSDVHLPSLRWKRVQNASRSSHGLEVVTSSPIESSLTTLLSVALDQTQDQAQILLIGWNFLGRIFQPPKLTFVIPVLQYPFTWSCWGTAWRMKASW